MLDAVDWVASRPVKMSAASICKGTLLKIMSNLGELWKNRLVKHVFNCDNNFLEYFQYKYKPVKNTHCGMKTAVFRYTDNSLCVH